MNERTKADLIRERIYAQVGDDYLLLGLLTDLERAIEAEALPRVTHHDIGSSESCDFCRLYRDKVAETPPTDT